jgi:hypothetical protein
MVLLALSGCAGHRPEQPKLPEVMVRVYGLVGNNFLSGQAWNWGGLSAEETEAILSRRMPKAEEVKPEATSTEVLEQVTGRAVVWIPELTPEQKAEPPMLYREEMANWPDHGPARLTVKEYLRPFLTMSSEFGYHLPVSYEPDDPEMCNVILVTRDHLLIIAVPADTTKP